MKKLYILALILIACGAPIGLHAASAGEDSSTTGSGSGAGSGGIVMPDGVVIPADGASVAIAIQWFDLLMSHVVETDSSQIEFQELVAPKIAAGEAVMEEGENMQFFTEIAPKSRRAAGLYAFVFYNQTKQAIANFLGAGMITELGKSMFLNPKMIEIAVSVCCKDGLLTKVEFNHIREKFAHDEDYVFDLIGSTDREPTNEEKRALEKKAYDAFCEFWSEIESSSDRK